MRYYVIICLCITVLGKALVVQASSIGSAGATVLQHATSASIIRSGTGTLNFGSFRVGTQASSIFINNGWPSTFSTTGDVEIVSNPSEHAGFRVTTPTDTKVTVHVGNAALFISATDDNRTINQQRSVGTLQVDTTYKAFFGENTNSSSCVYLSCTFDGNKVDTSGQGTLNSGVGTDMELRVAGRLFIPANAVNILKFGTYNGTFPITVTY